MVPTAAIVAEAQKRNWVEPQTLAVLMLAIDEGWTEVPSGFFVSLDALEHPTIDWEYNLAQLRRVDPQDWQAFKMRLYRHMRQAVDLLNDAAPTEEWTAVFNELMGLS